MSDIEQSNMNIKRQRVIDAIHHIQTDRTPWQIDFTSCFKRKYEKEIDGQNLDVQLGNHLYREKYKQNEKLENNQEKDLFGVTWQKTDDGGDVGVVIGFPLKEKNLKDYIFPEVKIDFAKQQCEKLAQDSSGRFRMFSLTMLYYERAWSLKGMEELLMDMCLDEKGTMALFDKILDHHLKLLNVVLDYDFEGVYFGDDWGQQSRLIMGPKMWRKYIKPGLSQMYDLVKSKGKYIVQHSCGDLRAILPDLIDMGLDVYNTVQPEIYDLARLKQEYGKDLTFYGGLSTQQFLPKANPKECEDMAHYMLEVFGKNGGFIFAPTHDVTPDIPFENILALINIVRNFYW